MGSAPAETVAADADAVAQRLAVRQHQVKPPLAGVDDDGAGRVIARIVDGAALDRAYAATAIAAEVGTAAHDVAQVETLGVCVAGRRQHRLRRNQNRQPPGHFLPREKSDVAARQAISQAVSHATST